VIFTADAKTDEALTRLGYRTFRHASFGDLPATEHGLYVATTLRTIYTYTYTYQRQGPYPQRRLAGTDHIGRYALQPHPRTLAL
jgi:hypothetical protein